MNPEASPLDWTAERRAIDAAKAQALREGLTTGTPAFERRVLELSGPPIRNSEEQR